MGNAEDSERSDRDEEKALNLHTERCNLKVHLIPGNNSLLEAIDENVSTGHLESEVILGDLEDIYVAPQHIYNNNCITFFSLNYEQYQSSTDGHRQIFSSYKQHCSVHPQRNAFGLYQMPSLMIPCSSEGLLNYLPNSTYLE
ncbi:hypothetical protein MG293_017539 [Ovis ammon polii]|uniref:Uncharacterized protein n=1 Tax=Ovis ammon polii TaxID=230172 RepID=A0AAD4TTU8_OVIAM|nr:hypothetical protein MG293_017539 [Ovis ammon polii]